MRVAAVFGVALALVAGGAQAQELVATRPGLMCRSAEALGKLTLPNGDSRTHAATRQPGDMALAAAGGCIDIPDGARVTVLQAFHNTSIVSYGAPNMPPYVVPNIDFQPAGQVGAAEAAAIPAGYAVVRRIAETGPNDGILVLLEDSRLTPRLREALWGSGDPELVLDQHDPLLADLKRRPLLDARLRLLSSAGTMIAETKTEYPLAKIEVAPIHGLPISAIIFTVDASSGMGGFSGPFARLLTPATSQLAPVQFVADGNGRGGDMALSSTLHAGWRIVPPRQNGPEEIESAYCPGGDQVQVLTLWTYRFRDGHWHRAERRGGACVDVEEMPPRSAFP